MEKKREYMLDKAMRGALNKYLKESREEGMDKLFRFTRYRILGYDLRKVVDVHDGWTEETRKKMVFDLLIGFTASRYENNIMAFEVHVGESGEMGVMFNGSGYMSVTPEGKVSLLNDTIHYGSWTAEDATAWLKKVERRMEIEMQEGIGR